MAFDSTYSMMYSYFYFAVIIEFPVQQMCCMSALTASILVPFKGEYHQGQSKML